jgi:citrate lyase subunit beta / citryl-CoA lyase
MVDVASTPQAGVCLGSRASMSSAQALDRRAAREATRIDGENARSWQLVNALKTDQFDTAHLGRADQIILDMEDAVAGSLKEQARQNVVGWLKVGWLKVGWLKVGWLK